MLREFHQSWASSTGSRFASQVSLLSLSLAVSLFLPWLPHVFFVPTHLFSFIFFLLGSTLAAFANEKNFERSEAPDWTDRKNYQEFFALTNESAVEHGSGMQLGQNQNGQKRREKTTKMAIEIVIQPRLDFYELHLLRQQSPKKIRKKTKTTIQKK